ncbi:MAG: diguanylate cyclase [Chloroflexi bacterium]|nr:MAG: diguanylate cyclase [Chloroflexota bacterium]
MAERILIADDDAGLRQLLQDILEEHEFDVITVPSGEALVRAAVSQQPDLLLIDVNMPLMDGLEAVRQLRNDTRTSHLPMLLLTARTQSEEVVIGFESGADDYIPKPFDADELVARIKANLRRQARVPILNPLTQLPGNKAIADEVERRIKSHEQFGLLYFDFDNFKALNDVYGPARGDRVIKLLANILQDLHAAAQSDDIFVGHIGGDDFIALTPPQTMERLSNEVIARFDREVLAFYDPADKQRGYLRGVDRFGMPRRFPIVSVSIGGVTNDNRAFSSYEEVAAMATEMKSYAKKFAGSSLAINGRTRDMPVAPDEDRRGQPLTIVVVSPEPLLHEALQPLLSDGRCRSIAFTAVPRLQEIVDQLPDLVTLNVADPGCWPMAVALRESRPALPLVIASPHSEDERRAWACGAYAFIAEPFPPEYYRACVAQLLRLNERFPPTDGSP